MPFLLCYPKFIPQKQQAGLTTHKSRQDRSGHTQKIPNNFFLLLLAIALSLLYFRHYWLLFWSKYIQYILLQRVLCEKQHICRGIG